MNAKQPISRKRKMLLKRYIFIVFDLVTYKKRENSCKALYIWKQKDIARKVYNECFIVQKNHKAKKTQNLLYMERFPRYKNVKLMYNTPN